MTYPLEKCKTCDRFNHDTGKMRNKLICTFFCEEYRICQEKKAIEFNRAVSLDDFDEKKIYQHSTLVFGSGWKNDGV